MDRRVDKDIAQLYKFVLKFGMRVKNIRHAWMSVHSANKFIDPDYKYPPVPGYIKMAMKYEASSV
ncbi:hypothetical protein LCGC14_1637990 [marine sediment metagenome]|uniref:Uncharacterized protein n=1 Tax=marine sediment metagenome TaxID=412755 RepID=A0A0F9I0B7_9ZZZZ